MCTCCIQGLLTTTVTRRSFILSVLIIIKEPIAAARTGVVCQKCSSSLLRSNVCHRCQQHSVSSASDSRGILRTLSPNSMNEDEGLPQNPPASVKSDKPQKPNNKVVPGRKTPPKITERRFRIFHNDDADADDDTEDESPESKSTRESLQLQLMSPYKEQCLYQSSGCFSLSDTILEEQWTESTLSAITVVQITNESFDNHPFLDPSYGKDTTKLSFEGPCSFQAVARALQTFPAIATLEFGTGFFICEDLIDQFLKVPKILELPRIKSLIVNYDPERYDKMTGKEQTQVQLRILTILNVFSGGLLALDYCSLSLPETPELDIYLRNFIADNGLRNKGKIHYTGKMIRYTVDLSSEESLSNKPTTTIVYDVTRKRRAESPPEVQITKILSKEDKIQHVTLSSSEDDDDDDDINVVESNSNIPNPPPTSSISHHRQVSNNANNSRQHVIDFLSDASWREAHEGEWDSFDCNFIRIGDYVNKGNSANARDELTAMRKMSFSHFGLHFESPHFTEKGKFIPIGIPMQDITKVKILPNWDPSKSTILVQTNETVASWIRGLLGMSRRESNNNYKKGFYSPTSKNPFRRIIQFQTEQASQATRDLFKLLYRSKLGDAPISVDPCVS